MRETISKYKNLIISAAAFIVAGVILFSFFSGEDATIPAEPIDSQSARIERELLDELLKLQAIKLDNTFFGNIYFLSLKDFSKPLVEQGVGRSNPFAPVGAVSPVATSTP